MFPAEPIFITPNNISLNPSIVDRRQWCLPAQINFRDNSIPYIVVNCTDTSRHIKIYHVTLKRPINSFQLLLLDNILEQWTMSYIDRASSISYDLSCTKSIKWLTHQTYFLVKWAFLQCIQFLVLTWFVISEPLKSEQ